MRLHKNFDFTTLTWVKPELDETLRQAQSALQAYVEEGADPGELRACSSLLHQVQGTLRMVELYGAAMVAEEMEQLAKALIDGGVENREGAYAVLMQGIVQLPDYLERLQSGHRDIPIVLLPLLNQLRESRGEKGLPESVLFAPDLSRPLPMSAQGPRIPLSEDELRRRAETLRGLFQSALLRWLKDDNSAATIRDLTDVCEQLVPITSAEPARRLFWVAAGTLDALAKNAFPISKQLKQALAKIEQEIKRLAERGDAAFRSDPPIELTKQLLYFVAHEGSDAGRIGEIRHVFGLTDNTPSEAELAHARGSLTGHNRALLESVAGAIKEDLMRVKDALDLHLRTPGSSAIELNSQVEVLDRIADTLGMLGLGVPRRVVQEQRGAINQVISGERKNDEATLLDIAGALLYVEASLDDQVERLGQGEAEQGNMTQLPGTEEQKLLKALVNEAIANFAQARHCFVAFVETHWEHSQLAVVPRLLEEVGGALRILDIAAASHYLAALRRFTETELLQHRRVPSAQQMDRLADALASLEYFLEALRDRRPNREQILEVTQRSLEFLGYWPPTDAEASAKFAAEPVTVATDSARLGLDDATKIEPRVEPAFGAADRSESGGRVQSQTSVPTMPPPAVVAAFESVGTSPIPGFDSVRHEDIDDEIREVFLEEFEEEIANLGRLMPLWRSAPEDMESLRPIRRVFHTLKGSGRLVGAMTLGEFGWKIESLLNRVLDGTRPISPAVMSLIDHAVDVLPSMHAALQGESVYADYEGIQAAAERLIAGSDIAYSPPAASSIEVLAGETSVPSVAAVEEASQAIEAPPVTAFSELEPVEPTVAFEVSEEAIEPAAAFAIDPLLFEILKPEVAGHLEAVDAWLAECALHGPQWVTDPLLRAVHTMNGAFAMTEVSAITQVTAPLESFIKRSLASQSAPSAEGVALIAEAAGAIRQIITALDLSRPQLPHFDGLAARTEALRDTLPEPTQPSVPLHPEAEETHAMPQPVALEAPDDFSLARLDAFGGAYADTLIASEPLAEAPEEISESGGLSETGRESFADVQPSSEPLSPEWEGVEGIEGIEAESPRAAEVEAPFDGVESVSHAIDEVAEPIVEAELLSLDQFLPNESTEDHAFLLEEALPIEIEPMLDSVGPSETVASEEALSAVDADEALEALITAYAAQAPAAPIAPEAALQSPAEALPAAEIEMTPAPVAAESPLPSLSSPTHEPVADQLDDRAEERETEPTVEIATDDYYGLTLEELEALTSPHGAVGELASGLEEIALAVGQALAEPLVEDDLGPSVEVGEEALSLSAPEEPSSLEQMPVETEESAASTIEADIAFSVDGADSEVVEPVPADEGYLPEAEERYQDEDESEPEPAVIDAVESVPIRKPRPVVPHAQDPEDPDIALDVSELDTELLDIFLEESNDILDHSDGLLAGLRDRVDDRELVVGLQRDLHTLKGGARMAGIFAVGDLGHAMESLLESVAEGQQHLDDVGVVVLERGFDRLHGMVARIGKRKAVALPSGLIAQIEALALGRSVLEEAAAPPQAATAAAAAKPEPAPLKPLSAPLEALSEEDEFAVARAPQEQVRIRADLLDRLVNYAGEVAIYRARLEQQLGAFRANLGELNQTTTRLREQLRRLDIETEAQISARYLREQEELNSEFDPLELDRFTNQQQLSRALSESANDLVNLQGVLDDLTRQYETLLLQQSRVSSDLQEGLMRTRMVPFDALVPRLRRVLRQAASDTGKHVQLKVDGASGEMDRNVLDRMTAPLEHMLRNSMAHGLESPEERRKAGKPEEGLVRIVVQREGSEVVLKVSDDGRGLDKDAIRAKAIARGVLKADADISDEALYGLILEAGFSTAETVSRLSGRGVGMDVVYSEIRQLGGTLVIHSTAGKGSEFVIRLPFTLAVTQAVFVKIGETGFAVPIASVQGVGRIARAELDKQLATEKPVFNYAGEDYAIHDLGHLIGHAPAKAYDSLQMPLLLIRSGDLRAAICIDQVLGSREIVVKPVGPQVNSVPGIFGATIMGDGRVVVILDIAPLVRRYAAMVRETAPVAAMAVAPAPTHRVPVVMVVDDSITMRKVTGRVLERNNMEVLTAKDGVDAVEKMAERVPDLVLLDIEMPRMDGYEVAQNMRSDPRLKDVPIIMITSRTGDKHRQRAMDIGVNRYLGKPYQENELMRNVFEMLGLEPVNG